MKSKLKLLTRVYTSRRSRRSRRYNNRRMKNKFCDIVCLLSLFCCSCFLLFLSLSLLRSSVSLVLFIFLLVIAFFVRARLSGRIRSILALCFPARLAMERMGGIACNHCSDLCMYNCGPSGSFDMRCKLIAVSRGNTSLLAG